MRHRTWTILGLYSSPEDEDFVPDVPTDDGEIFEDFDPSGTIPERRWR